MEGTAWWRVWSEFEFTPYAIFHLKTSLLQTRHTECSQRTLSVNFTPWIHTGIHSVRRTACGSVRWGENSEASS